MKYRGWALVGIGVLLLGLVLIRYVGLVRYPAPSPDEGFWTTGAKNLVMFQDPVMDHRLHPLLSPSTFVILSAYFKAVGPSLLAARVYSAAVGLIAVGLMWGVGRESFPKRPWLLAIFFGMSSLVVLENRRMMIETQQMLWLAATAYFWLRTGIKSALAAGVCFAIALLTKSNSIFLAPALIWSAFGRDSAGGASARTRVFLFGLVAGSIAALAYLGIYAAFPEQFRSAYKYELDGEHFLNDDVIFHVGRFGLNLVEIKGAVLSLVKGAPFWLVLAPCGLVLATRQRWKERADRLFGGWLGVGFVFFFAQIYIAPRYLATLAPAFAYFAARTVNELLDVGTTRRWARVTAVVLLTLFLGYHTSRIARGIQQTRGANDYSDAVAWVTKNLAGDDRVIAAPYVGISLPLRAYDHFRMTRAYGHEDQPKSFKDVVRENDIRAIVVDDEVRLRLLPGDESFLRDNCARAASFGTIEIYRVNRAE